MENPSLAVFHVATQDTVPPVSPFQWLHNSLSYGGSCLPPPPHISYGKGEETLEKGPLTYDWHGSDHI